MELLGVSLILIIIIGVVMFFVLKEQIRKWSNLLFGTDSLSQGIKFQQAELANTPKSVSSMTKIYSPMITSDFPEFNLFEFSQKAENMLKSVFNAIENNKESLVVNASEDLKNQVSVYIHDLKSQGITEKYDDVKVHQTEIHKYQKQAGTCVIIFQMALEYYKYRMKDEAIISGRKDLKVQVKYNIHLVYIQDINKVKNIGAADAVGLVCPSCGAPVTNLGQKSCQYCGTGIKEINIHTWFLNKYEEI